MQIIQNKIQIKEQELQNLLIKQQQQKLEEQEKKEQNIEANSLGGGKRKTKRKKRKHKGINKKTGRLKKGYKYSGKILKSGLKQIIKKKDNKSICKSLLNTKIYKNIKEFKNGRWVSKAQAIAVSFSQVKKKRPSCKKIFKK